MRFFKASIVLLLTAGVMICACGKSGQKKVELKTLEDKLSYTVGYQIGNQLKGGEVTYNIDALSAGINDVVSNKEPLLTESQMDSVMMEMNNKIMAQRQQEADANLAKAQAFLDDNKKKADVVTLPSGLQYKVLSEGKGAKPAEKDTVTVHYRGSLIDGTEFDSSYNRGEPSQFVVGEIIKGWTEALQLMKVGSKWQLFISPDLGYGPSGAGPIPGNAALIFEVELLDIKKAK